MECCPGKIQTLVGFGIDLAPVLASLLSCAGGKLTMPPVFIFLELWLERADHTGACLVPWTWLLLDWTQNGASLSGSRDQAVVFIVEMSKFKGVWEIHWRESELPNTGQDGVNPMTFSSWKGFLSAVIVAHVYVSSTRWGRRNVNSKSVWLT